MPKALSLFELNNLVRKTIDITLNDEYWVEAELGEARENNGHLYLELVEKDEYRNTPVAKASAKCWRSTWMPLRKKFEHITGMNIKPGIKVLLKVYPQFHEAYGFSWIVTDLDPTYTMGDMARKRLEIINILKDEGVFDLNKQLALPMFTQNIAVVSSETAAGYGDFCKQLYSNLFGFSFSVRFYPTIMQGEGVEQSVISALNKIYENLDSHDCVVIIRGGGASSDLTGFDSLALAENIANFPLPIITGIGHERDETVADMVSHTKVKTPTAAAALLIDNLRSVAERLDSAQQRITNKVGLIMQAEQQRISRFAQIIPALFSVVNVKQNALVDRLAQRLATSAHNIISENYRRLDHAESKLPIFTEHILQMQHNHIELLAQRLCALDPKLLLMRGYSITTLHGKAVTDKAMLHPGDEIITVFANGTARSIVEK